MDFADGLGFEVDCEVGNWPSFRGPAMMDEGHAEPGIIPAELPGLLLVEPLSLCPGASSTLSPAGLVVQEGEGEGGEKSGSQVSQEGQAAAWLELSSPTTFASTSSSLSTFSTLKTTHLIASHACRQCQHVFATGDDLELHAIAERHRNFVCPAVGCSKAYFRRDACARHVAAHDDRRHTCTLCPADFARKDHLKRHVRVQHLNSLRSRPKTALCTANADIKKVKESELALRRELAPDNLAIKMLDIAGRSRTPEEGAQKAFACVVACAALSAPVALSSRTKRRLAAVVNLEPEIKPPDLRVLEVMEVG